MILVMMPRPILKNISLLNDYKIVEDKVIGEIKYELQLPDPSKVIIVRNIEVPINE